MLSLRAAAALMAKTGSAAQVDIVTALGFSRDLLELASGDRDRLGLADCTAEARVAIGSGALRALVLVLHSSADHRATLSRIARRLAANAPHLLWLVVATEGDTLAIATWSADRAAPRVAALVANRSRIVDSDAETLCALAAASASLDVLVHSRWLDILEREAIGARFFRALEQVVRGLGDGISPSIPAHDRQSLALLYVSRLLFLSFLETKGWLNGDAGFLMNGFVECMESGGGYQHKVLEPLFFGTLNTRYARRSTRARSFGRIPFLNGGLFARTPMERRLRQIIFADDALGTVFGDLLTRYRFTAREDTAVWAEAAVDPEMLGRAFESLMGATERKRSGAYYTPQTLVEHVTGRALAQVLRTPDVPAEELTTALAGAVPQDSRVRAALLDRIAEIRLLDPACGSGAFLVHALERLAAIRVLLGDTRPISVIRRAVLIASIHGVDSSPVAVWLCELRLWLSTVIESDERDPARVVPLPNLDRNVRVGDSLAGGSFGMDSHPRSGRAIAALRERYARAAGPRKRTLAIMLERDERSRAVSAAKRQLSGLVGLRRELVCTLRRRDLFGQRVTAAADEVRKLRDVTASVRTARMAVRALADGAALPFSFAVQFGHVAERNGFDAILGNPPWVRLHNVPAENRAALRSEFSVFRDAAWAAGAARTGAGAGFAAQVDLSALFLERSIQLLAPGATLALLLPGKLWRSLAGGGVRALLQRQARLIAVEDLTDSPRSFDAAVYPSILVASRNSVGIADGSGADSSPSPSNARYVVHGARVTVEWDAPAAALPFDESTGSPWIMLPPPARAAFDRLRRAGPGLASSGFGRPHLGVKSGCNDAFIVQLLQLENRLALVQSGETRGMIEKRSLRPLVRGETVRAWRASASAEHIVWTHASDGVPLRELPLHTRRWLARWHRQLQARTDARSRPQWWSLFRTDAASATDARVVWADFGRTPRAAVLPPGDDTVPLNTCYVIHCPNLNDAYALGALLNSPLVAAWLAALAEPARGGYHRYLGWTMALLPIPADWPRARAILAPVGASGCSGEQITSDALLAASVAAYRVRASDMEPLLLWTAR